MKAELSDLSLKGFSQYDFEYDKVAQELATITAAKKQYDAEMKNRGKAELGNEQAKATGENLRKARKELTLFERALNGIKGSAKNINNIKKQFVMSQKLCGMQRKWLLAHYIR